MGSESNLHKLSESIFKFKQEYSKLKEFTVNERKELDGLDRDINDIETEQKNLLMQIEEKEIKLKEYEKMITESENTYTNLVDNSNKLIKILEQETDGIKRTLNKNF